MSKPKRQAKQGMSCQTIFRLVHKLQIVDRCHVFMAFIWHDITGNVFGHKETILPITSGTVILATIFPRIYQTLFSIALSEKCMPVLEIDMKIG